MKLIIAAKQIKINNGSKLFISFFTFYFEPKDLKPFGSKNSVFKTEKIPIPKFTGLRICGKLFAPIDGTLCIAVTFFTGDSDVGD